MATTHTPDPAPPFDHTTWKGTHLRRALPVLVLVFAAIIPYTRGMDGAFVYDDIKQIVGNHLIREPGQLTTALSSDVWAFKGEREQPWSNYWRPTFVLWLAANNLAFGVDSTIGWHAASVGLHTTVTLLAFCLLLRLGVSAEIAFGSSLLFAVHPAHTESVAWISGSPDLLSSAGMLASLLLVVDGVRRRNVLLQAVALIPAALALGAKEIAVSLPVLIFAATLLISDHAAPWLRRTTRAIISSLPFVVLTTGYLALRFMVLGRFEIETPWRLSLPDVVVNAPQLLVFYLRQTLFPLTVGPSYPLRPLSALDLESFWMPVAILGVIGVGTAWLCRREPSARFGVVLFLAPLAPAFNINAFIEEQLVHDRYLYLPLLGAMMIALMVVQVTARRIAGASSPSTRRMTVAFAVAAGIPLAIQTATYTTAWTSEIRLWRWAVKVDPSSSFNQAQLGNALLTADSPDEALAALNRAIAAAPVTGALLDRGLLLAERGEFDRAEADLRRVLDQLPGHPLAYDRLAMVYTRQGRLDDAERVLRDGRRMVAYRECSFTTNLGVVLYLKGEITAALDELETARSRVDIEHTPACRMSLFHLGSLYAELGRPTQAAAAYREYIDRSANDGDRESLRRRELARNYLAR